MVALRKEETVTPVQTAKDLATRYQRSIIPVDETKRTPVLEGVFKKDGTPARLRWKPYQSKRATAKQIAQWQTELNPSAYAQITGAISGIITLDFDGEKGKETLAKLGLKPHRKTPNGFQVDFVHPGWNVKSLNHKSSAKSQWTIDYPGMDIRGDGGIALVAGRNKKGPYLWERDPGDLESLKSLPHNLRESLGLLHAPVEKEKPAQKTKAQRARSAFTPSEGPIVSIAKHALEKYLADIPLLGGRDNSCFSLACQLRDNGYSEQEATSVCIEFASRAPLVDAHGNLDTFTESDAIKCATSAYSYAKRDPWAMKSERKELIAIRHIVPQVSREEHARLLHEACLTIRMAITDHITRNDGTILLIIVPPGVGKSEVAAEIARDDFIVAWMAQNHAMANSIKPLQHEDIVHIQPCDEDTCSHYTLHHILGKKRINTYSIHSKHDEPCDHVMQFEHPGTTVFMQQYIKSGYPAQKQAIIIDEVNTSNWLPEIEISIATLHDILMEISSTECFEDLFIRAMQGVITDCAQSKTPIDGIAIFDRLNKNEQLVNWLGVLGKRYTHPLLYLKHLDIDDSGLERYLTNHAPYFLPMIIKALLFELVRWQKGELANSRIRIGPSAKGYSLFISEPVEFVPIKEKKDDLGTLPPIILLDATGDEALYAKMLGKPVTTLRIDVPCAPGTKHIAVRLSNGKRYGITSLCRYDTTKDLDRAIREVRYMLKRQNISEEDLQSGNVGLVTFKDCRVNMAKALGIPSQFTLHFGDLRGKNELKDCKTLLVVGTYLINPTEIERQTRVLAYDNSEPVTCDPKVWKEKGEFSNPHVHQFAQFLTNSELTQAAHRNRPVRFEDRTVISFCMADIDFLPITEEITQFPSDINEEGQNESEIRDDVRTEKMETAYTELSQDGKRVTVSALASKAGVRKQTASQWIQANEKQFRERNVESTIALTEPCVSSSNIPTGGQSTMINPDDMQRYHGIEKGAKVITPLGQGTVVLIRGIGPRQVRVTVSVEKLGWKSFKSEEVKPFIHARQEPLPANAGLDALFAGIGC